MNEEQLKVVLKAEFGNFFSQVKDTIKELRNVSKEAKQAKQFVSEFSRALSSDAKALGDAKQKFIDIANAYGKTSDKAQQAALKIKMLSSALADNQNKYKELSNLADSFDVSISQGDKENNSNNTSEEVGKTEKAILDLKQTMAEVRNFSFLDFAITAVDGLRKSFQKAKLEIHGVGGAIDNIKNALLAFSSKKTFTNLTDSFDGSLGDRVKWFSDSLKNAGEDVASSFATLGSGIVAALGPVGIAVAGIAVSIGIIAAQIAAIVGLCKNALSIAKEIKELNTEANKVNMNIRSYQEWGYVLKQCGIESSKLTDFIKKLSEKQKEVLNGSEEATKAYEELGMSAEEVVSMGQEELFAKTIEKLQGIENTTQRTSIAYRIFTDDAVQLNSVLHLTNQETQSLKDSFYALGAAPSDNLINKSLILQASTTNLSYAWQGLKNTLAEWVMPAIIAVVQWITKAIAVVNVFLKAILGVDLSASFSKSNSGINKGMSNLNKNIKDNTKSAEKLKRTLMGFDELNVVGNPSSASGDAAAANSSAIYGGSDFSANLPIIEPPDVSGITEWVEKYKTVIQDIATWTLILLGLFLIIFNPGNIPLMLIGIGLAGLGVAIGSVDGGTFDRLAEKIKGFVEKALNTVKEWVDNIGKALNDCYQWIDKNFIQPVKEVFKNLWNKIVEIFTPIVKWFSELFKSIWESIKSRFEVIVGIFRGSWDAIKAIWGVVSNWFNEKIIQPVGGFFKDMWEGISSKAEKVWGKVKGFAKDAWTGIKSVFEPVVEWFSDKFRKAWEGVKNVFSTGGKIFEGIKEGISSVFKSVVNGIISGINTVIAVPFNTINGLLNKIRSVEVAGIKPFEKYIKHNALSIPQIPKLATGGIAIGSVLANVGEAGKEAILPLENNTGWMDILADKIASRNGGNAPTKLVLKVGEREFGEVAINAINGITRQSGALQLEFA